MDGFGGTSTSSINFNLGLTNSLITKKISCEEKFNISLPLVNCRIINDDLCTLFDIIRITRNKLAVECW